MTPTQLKKAIEEAKSGLEAGAEYGATFDALQGQIDAIVRFLSVPKKK